jgi:hypothetical protein
VVTSDDLPIRREIASYSTVTWLLPQAPDVSFAVSTPLFHDEISGTIYEDEDVCAELLRGESIRLEEDGISKRLVKRMNLNAT